MKLQYPWVEFHSASDQLPLTVNMTRISGFWPRNAGSRIATMDGWSEDIIETYPEVKRIMGALCNPE